jgi:hypothetical protein
MYEVLMPTYVVPFYSLLQNDFQNKKLWISIQLILQQHNCVDSNKDILSLGSCQPSNYFDANLFYSLACQDKGAK